jgi:hypothetical protein
MTYFWHYYITVEQSTHIYFKLHVLFYIFYQYEKYAYTVKPVYKDHSREPENVPFIYSLKLFINGENETV